MIASSFATPRSRSRCSNLLRNMTAAMPKPFSLDSRFFFWYMSDVSPLPHLTQLNKIGASHLRVDAILLPRCSWKSFFSCSVHNALIFLGPLPQFCYSEPPMYQSKHSLHHPVALTGAQKTQMSRTLVARVRKHARLVLRPLPPVRSPLRLCHRLHTPSQSPPCR